MRERVLQLWAEPRVRFLLACVLLFVLLGLSWQVTNPWLRFDRVAIEHGQWWRLISCHLVHLNPWHLALNLSGFILLGWFFDDVMTLRIWLLAFALFLPLEGLALYFLNPELSRYVGLSGVLHGFFVLALILGARTTPKLNLLVLGILSYRIWSEQQPGYDVDYLHNYIQGSVFVDAHLYGATMGLVLGLILLAWQRWRPA